MPKAKPRIRILFRIDRTDKTREVVAILPDIDANPGRLCCYVHTGQHGEADISWYRQRSRAATPAESASLLRELTGIYSDNTLVVRTRLNRK